MRGKSKKEIIEAVALRAGIDNTLAAKVVNATLSAIVNELDHGHSVTLHGFGKFGMTTIPARRGAHPITGAIQERKPLKKISFRCSGNHRINL